MIIAAGPTTLVTKLEAGDRVRKYFKSHRRHDTELCTLEALTSRGCGGGALLLHCGHGAEVPEDEVVARWAGPGGGGGGGVTLPFIDFPYGGPTLARACPGAAGLHRAVQAVCEGLASLHAAGLAHMDVKADNVVLDEATGSARLIDFGLVTSATDRLLGCGSLQDSTYWCYPPEVLVNVLLEGDVDETLQRLLAAQRGPLVHAGFGHVFAQYRYPKDVLRDRELLAAAGFDAGRLYGPAVDVYSLGVMVVHECRKWCMDSLLESMVRVAQELCIQPSMAERGLPAFRSAWDQLQSP